MSKEIHTPRTVARGVPAAPVPRPLAFARGLFLLSGVLSAVYVGLALIQLDHLRNDRVVNGVRDVLVYTVGLALVATVTMLSFAVLVRRARPWTRRAMIITCVALIALVAALVTVDAAILRTGSSLLVTAWFPVAHYVTAGVLLVAAIGGLVGLIGSDAGAYFRRHQQVAADDRRLWSVSRLRDLQLARAEVASISNNRTRMVPLALLPGSPATHAANPPEPAPVAVARAA